MDVSVSGYVMVKILKLNRRDLTFKKVIVSRIIMVKLFILVKLETT